MKRTNIFIIALGAFALSGGWAFAQDDGAGDNGENGDFDVTMRMIPEHVDLPDVVTQDIEIEDHEEMVLPPPAQGNPTPSDQGIHHSAEGLRIATDAVTDGRGFGEAMRDAAQNDAENLGRGLGADGLQDLLPDHVPDIPDLPNVPNDLPDGPDLPTPPAGPQG